MLLLMIAASLAAATPPRQPGDLGYLTAAQLSARCADSDPVSISYCYGYLAAVHDSVRAYENWLHMREFCAPDQTSQSDLHRAFVGYLDAHPTDKSGQAASVVLAALKQRYPCPVQK